MIVFFLYKKLPSHFIVLLRKIDKYTKPMDLTRLFKYLYTYFLRKKIYQVEDGVKKYRTMIREL